jgi:hypothetical protein
MKAYGGLEVHLHAALTLALGSRERAVSRTRHFTFGERAPGTHWFGWVGPTAGIDAVKKRKSFAPCSTHHAFNQISKLAELSRLPSLVRTFLYVCDPDPVLHLYQFEIT